MDTSKNFNLNLTPNGEETLDFLESLQSEWWEPTIYKALNGDRNWFPEGMDPSIDISRSQLAIQQAEQSDLLSMRSNYQLLFWLVSPVVSAPLIELDIGPFTLNFTNSENIEFNDAYGILGRKPNGDYYVHCLDKETMDREADKLNGEK